MFLSSGTLVFGDRGVAGSQQKCHASWPDFWGAFTFSVASSLFYCIPDICVCVGMQREGFGNVVTNTSLFLFVSVVC